MLKKVVTVMTRATVRGARRHLPELLTVFGGLGMLTTVVLAVKATPRAMAAIEAEKKERNVEEITPVETIKVAGKYYLPAVMTGAASIGCLAGSATVSHRRIAALIASQQITEVAMTEGAKVVEDFANKTKVAETDKKADDKRPPNSEVVSNGGDEWLCVEAISGRRFKSSINKMRSVMNELNRQMLFDSYVTLSDLYDMLGLEHTADSDDRGWKISHDFIEPRFETRLLDDGAPCIVLDYARRPKDLYI